MELQLPGLNYTSKQMFWISFANVWCVKSRPRAVEDFMKTGSHSPANFRLIGVVSNSREFAEDFNCKVNSPMNPKNKCAVWT